MTAMLNQHTAPVPEIIDFVAFRGALPRRAAAERPAKTAGAVPGDAVIVAFPATRALQMPDRASAGLPGGKGARAASELSVACALLVESFHAVHAAVSELQESCRMLDANAGDVNDQAGAVLIGIAQLSTTAERFQDQLDATIDAAFH
jgi:hypothetical protein